MKSKISEIRTAFVLIFITIAVGIAGILLYKNLSSVSEEVSASYQKREMPSEMVRQITVEFREAENCIKSYNLTHNDDYLISFFKSAGLVEEKLNILQKETSTWEKEKEIIDSIVILSEERFELMKKQLFMDDEKNVTNELNVISNKLKKTQDQKKITEAPKKDTTAPEKTTFFNRLFGKKKKSKTPETEIVSNPGKTQAQIDSIADEIAFTVQYVKDRQFRKIQNRQETELESETKSKALADKIHIFYLELEKGEKKLAQEKITLTQKKVNDTRNLAIVVSVIISILLLLVTWFIVFYSRKKAEYESALLKAKQEAEDLAKTKEMFLANMSHEIKTPLNAIYGFTDQVLRTPLSPDQKDQLNVVKRSTTHLINLITDILNYSKIQSGRMNLETTDFQLKEELAEIEMLFKPIAQKKNILLIIEISHTLPKYIQGDLTKFKQILMNIIGNAIKFTERGHVKIVIEKDEFSKKNQDTLALTVSDTGIGIPADKISNLFNEYEQAHPGLSQKYGGTGLGLVITKKLVELMGGSIRLESEETKGTQAFISIPFKEGKEPKHSSKNGHVLNTESLQSKKVLIADDEEYNRLLLKTILSKYKIHVIEAADGAEAVKLIKSTPIDLVLMDLNMPIKNGIEACKEIRKIPGMDKDHLSILVSSAVQNDEKAEELKSAGFNGSLFKPFTEEELITKLLHFTNTSPLHMDFSIKVTNPPNANIKKKLSFDNIESIANGDEQFKKEMIQIFHKSINQGIEQLAEACKLHLWKEVSDIAHKMMPPCKHFEADELYNILAFFETITEQGDGEPIVHHKLQQLKEELATINDELRIYL